MKHARTDYNRIQDPENKISKDEPVFLIRGQDINAPIVVAYWADIAEQNGASKEIVDAARLQAAEMLTWQLRNNKKIPDLV